MAPAISSPPPISDSLPPSAGGAFWPIIIEDKRGKWAYYTQNETLFDEYTEKGFCGMSRPFRQQFDHTCPNPKTNEHLRKGAKWLAIAIIVVICLALLATSIQQKYISRLEKRQARRGEERRCQDSRERTSTKENEADSVEAQPHAQDVESQNGVADRVNG